MRNKLLWVCAVVMLASSVLGAPGDKTLFVTQPHFSIYSANRAASPGGGGASWGSITGTLSSQSDLNTALSGKQSQLNGTGFVKASGTAISYDGSTYETSGSVAAHAALTATHGATGTIVGTTNNQALVNKTLNDLSNYIDSDAVHFKVLNNSGGTLAAGAPVYATQWNGVSGAVEVVKARANSASTMPALCLIETSINNGATGECRIVGALNNVNTNAWSDGAALYVSPSSAGTLTTTKPSGAGEIVQRIGTSVKQHASTGIIAVYSSGDDLVATYEPAGAIATHSALSTGVHGSGASSLVYSNDSRLTDSRTPTAHNQAASTITSGTLDGDRLPALSTTKAGAVPLTGTPSGKYLKDDGTWAAPPGGAGTPASTVTSETTYGISAAVGTGTDYARNDHTHGTPATVKDTTAVTGILYGNGSAVAAAVAGNFPTLNQATTASAATLTTARNIGGRSFNGSADIVAPTYKTGLTTRDITTASGTVNVAHGLGRVPSLVRVTAVLVQVGNTTQCYGVYDGTNHSGMATIMQEGTSTAVTDTTYTSTAFELGFSAATVVNPYTGANRQTATITVDATNIIFSWIKTGTVATAVANILWEVM